MTGPSYPARGSADLGGPQVSYRLPRAFPGAGDAPVRIAAPEPVTGLLHWRRHKTTDEWTVVPMRREGGELVAELPHQPPAGKLQYRIVLRAGSHAAALDDGVPVVIRFRGDVPAYIIVPHVLAMFTGMLLSTRTGLEAFFKGPSAGTLALTATGLITVGGMILGPIVQFHAFGAYWTGWPFGTDLTDNKTAVVWVLWLIACYVVRRSPANRSWPVAAAVATFIIFVIPHSLFGSELEYGSTSGD
jgi:hypothetical protein